MICAVVLGAGKSERMGAPKLLLPFGGDTVIGHIADVLLSSVVDEVFLVVGHYGAEVIEALAKRKVSIAENPRPGDGMLSSVRCALEALPEDCEAVMVVLGDQPSISAALIDGLAKTFSESSKGIAVPVHEGQRGHPLVFSTEYREEIMTSFDDTGLRGLLHAHPDEIVEHQSADPGVLLDMNFPEDYRRALDAFEGGGGKGPPKMDSRNRGSAGAPASSL